MLKKNGGARSFALNYGGPLGDTESRCMMVFSFIRYQFQFIVIHILSKLMRLYHTTEPSL